MSFLKKSIFVFGILFFCFGAFPTGNAETFTKYKAPDIKDDFCGKAMSAYNCKCAWHGKYCDKVGMSQDQAATYVRNEYSKWLAPQKKAAKEACEDIFNPGIWTGSGCRRCEPQKREIRIGDQCKSLTELCSDDPDVRYRNGECVCVNGATFNKKTGCETPCDPKDPNLFYDQEIDECICKSGFAYDGEMCVDKCGTNPDVTKNAFGECICIPGAGALVGEAPFYECSNDCGDDPYIYYDEEYSQCICDEGYQRVTRENKFACEEKVDANIQIEFPDQKPPFVAKGEKTYTIHVSVTNPETNEGVKAHFKLKSGTGHSVGSIINTEENELGDYALTYQPPTLETGVDSASDYLFTYFYSPTEKKEVYKTYEMGLVSPTPIVIKKAGFQPQDATVVFYSENAKVTVYTQMQDGQKIPVQGAQVGIKGEVGTEVTAEDGDVLLRSSSQFENNTIDTVEVLLEMTPEIKENQKESNAQYRQIVEGSQGITNPTVKDFIQNFEKYLAQTPEDKSENMVIGLRRVGYALLYMTEGRELSDDIAKEVGNSIKNQIADTLDLIGASDKINDTLKDKISTDKISEPFESLTLTLNKKLNGLTGRFQNNIVNTLKSGIQRYAPQFKDDWTDEILTLFFSNPLDDYSKDNLIESGTEKAQNWSQDKIASMITDYLKKEYDLMLRSQMKELSQMIKGQHFNVGEFETNRQQAKESFTELRSTYLSAHEVSYNVSFIKDSADLFNNTIGEAGKITGLWKAQAEAFETVYKSFRSGILNNVEIFYWFDAYGDFYYDVQHNIDQALGRTSHKQKTSSSWAFIPVAYAEAPLDVAAQSQQLTFSEDELKLLQDMEAVNELLLQIYPEDPNLQELQMHIDIRKPQLKTDIETMEPLVSEYRKKRNQQQNELDTDGDGEVTLKDITLGEWGALGFVLFVIVFVIWGIKKIVRKIRG